MTYEVRDDVGNGNPTSFYVYTLDFFDAWDCGDAVYGTLEFRHGVDGEVNSADSDAVCGFSSEASHRKLEFLSYAVYQITEEVVSVKGTDTDADRIEAVRSFFICNRHD